CRAFFCAHSMVLSGAPSAFCKKSRLPLSSTIQSVTSTFSSLAFASAAATIVLIAARFRYLLLGRSADDASATKPNPTKNSLNMRRMLSVAFLVFQVDVLGWH